MSIVNFSDVLSKQLQNKKLLLEFEEKFLIYLNDFKEEIIENNNVKNFELLLERYDEVIKLYGKKEYMFIDVFKYVSVDLIKAKGLINLILNGNKVGYTTKIEHGDNIKVFWT